MQDLLYDKQNLKYVGFWRRVGSTFLDGLIISPLVIPYYNYSKYFIDNGVIFPIILYYIIMYGFQFYFIVKFGGTPGKLIMKYRIVDEKGNYLSIKNAIMRDALYIPSAIIYILLKFVYKQGAEFEILSIINNLFSYIALVDVLVIVPNKKKRALHDYLAHSFVATKESLSYMHN